VTCQFEEAAREGDWEYLRKMTEYWKIDRDKYPDLDVAVRGRANSIYPQVLDKAWDLILKDEKILLHILKGIKDKEKMIDFLRDLISRNADTSPEGAAQGLRRSNIPLPDIWIETFLSNPNFTSLDLDVIAGRALRGESKRAFLQKYQERMVHTLRNQGIEIKAENQMLQTASYIPVLDALSGFPDWLVKVQPEVASGDQKRGFRVKKWMTSLKINSKGLGQRFLERFKHIGIFNIIHYFGYDWMNRLSDYRGITRNFNTPLDQAIPLVPQAVFVYLLLFPIIFLPAFLVKKVREFRAAIGAFFTALFSLFTVFMLFPARMTRPESILGDSWAHDILRWYYQADLPYNTTPSNHVTLSALAGLILFRSATHPFRHIHLIVGAMIGLSTVFVKQHFVVDILSGWLVAYLSFKIWFDWTKYWMEPLRNFFKGRWKNSSSAFMKKIYVWLIGQLYWFKVSDVDRYPAWRIDIVKDLRNAKSVSHLQIAFDTSIKRKDRFVIRDGVIYMHPEIIQASGGRENFYENLYNKVLEHMALASRPYALAEKQRDETFEERLGHLSAKDLYELDESILNVLGGEEKARQWFDSWNLKYSFADFKEALNVLRVYFVLTPVLLDYRMFDHLMTQAALVKDDEAGAGRRDDFYRASLAFLVEGLHDHMHARLDPEFSEIIPLPDAVKKAQSAMDLEFIRDEALRDMMDDFKIIAFDEMAWDMRKNEFQLKNHGKLIKRYALGELMKNPDAYQKIQAEWQSRGIEEIRWARSLGAYRILHQLNVFFAGVPDRLPENINPIGFRDPRGYIHYLQMARPGVLFVNRFNALDDLPSAAPVQPPLRVAESVDAAA
jgi:membrane-associated phospholipid phosphatase